MLGAAADVDRHGLSYALGREHQRAGGVIDEQKVARGAARSPHHDSVVTVRAGVDELAYQCRDHVRVLWVVVIAGPVQVGEDWRARPEAVLGPIRLRER